MARNNQVTGNIGLYYVCYQLSRKGYNAIPTSRNSKGVDIIVYNDDCSKMLGIQVKTLSKKNPVPLGKKENSMEKNIIWVVVNETLKDVPNVYVFTAEEIKNNITSYDSKDGGKTAWFQPKIEYWKANQDKWDKIDSELKANNSIVE